MPMQRSAPLILAILSLAAAPPAAGTTPAASAMPPSPPSTYATLAAVEARVAAIGFRLTVANAVWCPVRQPQFGWVWGDPRLYDAQVRTQALTAYRAAAGDHAFVAAVAAGSPASIAGIGVGDSLLTIAGAAVPPGEGDHPFARITAIETYLAAQPTDKPLKINIGSRSPTLTPAAGCVSDFRVEANDRPAAVADGRMVLVNQGLAEFAADDNELAAAIAHELAHNILRHRARLDAAGVDRGLGRQFGRSARLFRQTEVEADRLSVWLLAGAGYDPAAAARFWRKFGQRRGRPLFQAGTHPNWRDRVDLLDAEAATIAAARTAGEALRPPLIDAPPPLE